MPKLSDGGEPPYYVDEETVNSFGGGGRGCKSTSLAPTGSVYCIYANKTQNLIIARKFAILGLFIMYLNVASDDLYQKITPN